MMDNAYSALEQIVRNKDMEYDTLWIGGEQFIIFGAPSVDDYGKQNGEAAEYVFHHTHWTVYIWEDLPRDFQEALLMHELAEILLYRKTMLDGMEAHNKALKYEEKYCKANMSKKRLNEYIKFKARFGVDEFEPMK